MILLKFKTYQLSSRKALDEMCFARLRFKELNQFWLHGYSVVVSIMLKHESLWNCFKDLCITYHFILDLIFRAQRRSYLWDSGFWDLYNLGKCKVYYCIGIVSSLQRRLVVTPYYTFGSFISKGSFKFDNQHPLMMRHHQLVDATTVILKQPHVLSQPQWLPDWTCAVQSEDGCIQNLTYAHGFLISCMVTFAECLVECGGNQKAQAPYCKILNLISV